MESSCSSFHRIIQLVNHEDEEISGPKEAGTKGQSAAMQASEENILASFL